MVVRRKRVTRSKRSGKRPLPVNRTKRLGRRPTGRSATVAARRGTKRRAGSVLAGPSKRRKYVRKAPRRMRAPYEYDKIRALRQRPRQMGMLQLIKSVVPWRILQYRAVNGLDRNLPTLNEAEGYFPASTTMYADYSGGVPASFCISGAASVYGDWTSTAAVRWLGTPIYCINLTATVNPATNNAAPVYRLFQRFGIGISSGTWQWVPVAGKSQGGTFDSTWQVENWSGHSQVLASAAEYIRPCWYDLRFNFRNAKSQVTWFDIKHVHFSDDVLDPVAYPTETGLGPQEVVERGNFLGRLVSQYVNPNPIVPKLVAGNTSKYKMFCTRFKRVYMRTQQSNDEDTSANVTEYRQFIRDGRVLCYQNRAAVNAAAHTNLNELTDPYYWDNKTTSVKADYSGNPIDTRKRRYVLVAAFDPSRTASAGGETNTSSSLNCPSFDFVFRKKDQCASISWDRVTVPA